MWAEVITAPVSATNSGPLSTSDSRRSMISRAAPTIGVMRCRLFFERAGGSVQIHLLGAKPADFATTRADQKLKPQDVSRIGGQRSGIEPSPEGLDFLDGQDPIARSSTVVRLEPSGRVRLDDVLRQRPAKRRGTNLSAFFRLPAFAR